MSSALAKTCNNEAVERGLAKDVKALVGWLEREILALADPSLDDRRELFDFIVDELAQREHLDSSRIRVALKRQRDKLLGFAKVLDGKLAAIALRFDVPEHQVRAVCLAAPLAVKPAAGLEIPRHLGARRRRDG